MSRWLLGALLINPDVSTFWNMRRELLRTGRLEICSELHLTSVILSRKPKSGEAFSYRKWLVKKFLLQNGVDKNLILDQELAVSQDSAGRYANNYHAWSHRTWCMLEISPQTSNLLKTVLNEWALSEEWIKSHVSDHSGLQFRQFLQKRLTKLLLSTSSNLLMTVQGRELMERSISSLSQYISLDGAIYEPTLLKSVIPNIQCTSHPDRGDVSPVVIILSIIACELFLNVDLILRFSGHEALWCHRRYLLSSLVETLALQQCNFPHEDAEQCFSFGKVDTRNTTSCGSVGRRPARKENCPTLEYQLCMSSSRNHVHSHKNNDGIPLEKDQKLGSSIDLDADQVCKFYSKAISWHEYHLVKKCFDGEEYQRKLATRHCHWLSNILRIDVPYQT